MFNPIEASSQALEFPVRRGNWQDFKTQNPIPTKDEWIEKDFLIMIEPEDCEAYKIPEGILLIGRADQFGSQGFVDIDPGKSLPPRSRSAPGTLKQMAGESV